MITFLFSVLEMCLPKYFIKVLSKDITPAGNGLSLSGGMSTMLQNSFHSRSPWDDASTKLSSTCWLNGCW